MLFNSLEFLVFLAVVYALYRVLPFRSQNIMLLAASYLFYGWWDWRFLFLMIATTSIDFWSGLVIDRGRLTVREKAIPSVFLGLSAIFCVGMDVDAIWVIITDGASADPVISPFFSTVVWAVPLALLLLELFYQFLKRQPDELRRKFAVTSSIVFQLSVLGFFKYFNFFTDSFEEAFSSIGITMNWVTLEVILPVGISFYTFQSMSYAIDIYRREMKPTSRYFDFAFFVSFFPQLVAGPIERARTLLPQIANPRTISSDQIQRGLFLIMFGLFKKIAIADGVAGTVGTIFGRRGTITFAETLQKVSLRHSA